MGDPDHRNIFDGNAEDARVIRDMAKARRWLDLADNPKHLRLMGSATKTQSLPRSPGDNPIRI